MIFDMDWTSSLKHEDRNPQVFALAKLCGEYDTDAFFFFFFLYLLKSKQFESLVTSSHISLITDGVLGAKFPFFNGNIKQIVLLPVKEDPSNIF